MCDCRRKGTAFEYIPGTTACHQIWLPKTHLIFKMIIMVLLLSPKLALSEDYHSSTTDSYYEAVINITYKVKATNETHFYKSDKGRFGVAVKSARLKVEPESGVVVVVKTVLGKKDGCGDYNVTIPQVKWIALIARGECSFSKKITNAMKYNASAVVVYNDKMDEKSLHVMEHDVEGAIAISIPYSDGNKIAGFLDTAYNVTMQITVGAKTSRDSSTDKNPSKTSVVFVSVSFIVLMIISLAWLVFYYIQRFRYAHAKERLARRLASAAKKAIAKIPQKTVKNGDKEMGTDFDQCAVCIEGYKAHDVIRTLPCKHVFHKSCVDPWLLDQRSCPMCKLDILRAYGMHVGGSEDSVHPDGESGNAMGPVEDIEQTSVGDEQSADGEVKVLLLPQHLCLHHGGETSTSAGRASIDSSHVTCDPSEDCAHSSDSECTELHSLMDHIGAAGVEPSCTVVNQKDSDTEGDLSV
ncbi:RING finger protein 150-like [Haliotis cracherodii]|uniref:RING finger protein 150-like n=1 Tax=Haliotis cracherodii TaxID=6455 RepID=UPI0039E880A7